MQALRKFLRSPLARHPGLFARKVAQRLHWYRDDLPVPAAPVAVVEYPGRWGTSLQQWMRQVPLNPEPHSFNRVFGHDFDEALLLRLCREGPVRGERGLTGDIKLIWDYSRGHPLFINACLSADHDDANAAFIRRWLEANPDPNGFAWTCAMDVAIRATNWILADVMADGGIGKRMGGREWAGCLWRHGFLIWRRLESMITSSNHYLADLLGLILIGSIFPNDPQARAWLRFARSEFPRALLSQTRADGGLNEASLRYHAFVTEMALLVRLAIGEPFPEATEKRLRSMCQIVADFRDATGDVFPFGDDDSGRVLAVDSATTIGRAEVLLRLASSLLGEEFKPALDAIYPDSGWWVRRAGEFTMAFEFGGVGLNGQGGHSHNDDLSFCLEWRGRSVMVDPGTYLYTSDPEARNQFRSVHAHNTLCIDRREPRELGREMFFLPGADAAFPIMQSSEDSRRFTRMLAGGLSHEREVSIRSSEVVLRDTLEGTGNHAVTSRFLFHPTVQPELVPGGVVLLVPGAGRLRLLAESTTENLRLVDAKYSPSYGHQQATMALVAEAKREFPSSTTWVLRVE